MTDSGQVEQALRHRLYLLERRNMGSNQLEVSLYDGQSVHNVTVCRKPRCSCKSAELFCIHVVFVLCKMLKVKSSCPMLLKEEIDNESLCKLLSNAPPDPAIEARGTKVSLTYTGPQDEEENRRRQVKKGDQCCICWEDFGNEELVWCRAKCGFNFHKGCFIQSLRGSELDEVTARCPLCQSPWQAVARSPHLSPFGYQMLYENESPSYSSDATWLSGEAAGKNPAPGELGQPNLHPSTRGTMGSLNNYQANIDSGDSDRGPSEEQKSGGYPNKRSASMHHRFFSTFPNRSTFSNRSWSS